MQTLDCKHFSPTMDLKSVAEQIENDLAHIYTTHLKRRANLNDEKKKCQEEYMAANTGDRSENAPLQAAIENLKRNNLDIRECENVISGLAAIEDAGFLKKIFEEGSEVLKGKRKYNSIGKVVMYSTVRLDFEGDELIFRIYPDGVSHIDIGVMAANSKLASSLMGKVVGDKVSVTRNSSAGKYAVYTIKEIY